MIGIGGGAFYVPILLEFNFSFKTASTISLIIIIFGSFGAFIRYLISGDVSWKYFFIVEPVTFISALLSAFFVQYISDGILNILLGIVLLLISYIMFKKDNNMFNGIRNTLFNIIFISALAGVLAGALGISGGVLKVPLLVIVCKLGMLQAVATSSLMIFFTSLSGLIGRILYEDIPWKIGITLGIFTVLGGFIGGHFAHNINKDYLGRIFFIILAFISLRILIKQFF